MLLVHQFLTDISVRDVQLYADHQTAATHFYDVLLGLLHLLQFLYEIRAHFVGVLYEVLALHHVEHCKGGGARQVVAAEGSAELTVDSLELWRDEQT